MSKQSTAETQTEFCIPGPRIDRALRTENGSVVAFHHIETPDTLFAQTILERCVRKIEYIQGELGNPKNILGVTLPDFSVTRNERRFVAGYCNGSFLSWKNTNTPFLPIDVLPDCCGTLLAKVRGPFSPDIVSSRLSSLRLESSTISGIPIEWDIGRKNHFCSFYEASDKSVYCIVHSAFPERKGDSESSFGLYWHYSHLLQKMSTVLQTPFGKAVFLQDHAVEEFLSMYWTWEAYSKKKREILLSKLVDEYDIMTNATHLGFFGTSAVGIGCYAMDAPESIFPLTTRLGGPAMLLAPHQPAICGKIPAWIIPHGTGSSLLPATSRSIDANGFINATMGRSRFSSLKINDHISGNLDVQNIGLQRCGLFKIVAELAPILEIKL